MLERKLEAATITTDLLMGEKRERDRHASLTGKNVQAKIDKLSCNVKHGNKTGKLSRSISER